MQGQAMMWATVAAVLTGLGGIIRGWQMGFRGRLDLISDWDNRPLPNPAGFTKAFAHIYIGIGCLLVVMPLFLWLGMNFLIWCAITVIIVWYWFHAIDVVAERARVKNR